MIHSAALCLLLGTFFAAEPETENAHAERILKTLSRGGSSVDGSVEAKAVEEFIERFPESDRHREIDSSNTWIHPN